MSSKPDSPDGEPRTPKSGNKPVWADGLRRMYDEVVDEKLPDEFIDLLKRLDQSSERS
ncbi:hypothetical protein SLG_10050 [Sphingobium sp. SYK-6]|nr:MULTISPECIES: NepR family anti-sigma factor [Sphingobium]BAK65680.1 hypothetical protein SLG_10050 [Sphingobium sp. SYK-6]